MLARWGELCTEKSPVRKKVRPSPSFWHPLFLSGGIWGTSLSHCRDVVYMQKHSLIWAQSRRSFPTKSCCMHKYKLIKWKLKSCRMYQLAFPWFSHSFAMLVLADRVCFRMIPKTSTGAGMAAFKMKQNEPNGKLILIRISFVWITVFM